MGYMSSMNIYNLILYIGLGLMALGFVAFIVSSIMEQYYDRKLWELEQKRKRREKWKA